MPIATSQKVDETVEPSRNAAADGPTTRKIFGTFALVIGGLLLVGILLFGVLGAFILGRGITDSSREIRELDPVAGAPEADLVMVVTPIGETGVGIDQLFTDGGTMASSSGMAVVSDSPRHISYVETPFATMALYTWQETEQTTDPARATNSCMGGTGEHGGFATCGPQRNKVPAVQSGSTEDNMGVSFDVLVDGLPADAKWVVVDTESGMRIAAEAVEGIAYLEWPAGEVDASGAVAQPHTVTALNDAFDEVWTTSIG